MSKKTLSRVLAELKSIRTTDMWVQDSINVCIALIQADMQGKKGNLPPHQSHSDTSTSAALSIAPKFGTMAREVLVNFTKYPNGLTDEEAQNIMGMQGNSYRPCRVTLMDRGFVSDSGERRKTNQRKEAVVWAVTPDGYKSLEQA
jgi:hypothetical protein